MCVEPVFLSGTDIRIGCLQWLFVVKFILNLNFECYQNLLDVVWLHVDDILNLFLAQV